MNTKSSLFKRLCYTLVPLLAGLGIFLFSTSGKDFNLTSPKEFDLTTPRGVIENLMYLSKTNQDYSSLIEEPFVVMYKDKFYLTNYAILQEDINTDYARFNVLVETSSKEIKTYWTQLNKRPDDTWRVVRIEPAKPHLPSTALEVVADQDVNQLSKSFADWKIEPLVGNSNIRIYALSKEKQIKLIQILELGESMEISEVMIEKNL